MIIKLYKTEDDPRVVDKTLTNEISITGTCKDTLDTFAPTILIGQDVTGYNYMYIPVFERYYFIDGCSIVRTGLYQIEGVKEDVLMSLKDQLLDLSVIIDKTESKTLGDEYIDDGSFITSQKSIQKVYNFPTGFNDTPDFILLTAGAIQAQSQ